MKRLQASALLPHPVSTWPFGDPLGAQPGCSSSPDSCFPNTCCVVGDRMQTPYLPFPCDIWEPSGPIHWGIQGQAGALDSLIQWVAALPIGFPSTPSQSVILRFYMAAGAGARGRVVHDIPVGAQKCHTMRSFNFEWFQWLPQRQQLASLHCPLSVKLMCSQGGLEVSWHIGNKF